MEGIRMMNLPGERERERNVVFFFFKLFGATQNKKKSFLETEELQEQRRLWGSSFSQKKEQILLKSQILLKIFPRKRFSSCNSD